MLVKSLIVIALLALASKTLALSETERLEGYYARNYTWPPKFHPNTPGWSNLMAERFEQGELLKGCEFGRARNV